MLGKGQCVFPWSSWHLCISSHISLKIIVGRFWAENLRTWEEMGYSLIWQLQLGVNIQISWFLGHIIFILIRNTQNRNIPIKQKPNIPLFQTFFIYVFFKFSFQNIFNFHYMMWQLVFKSLDALPAYWTRKGEKFHLVIKSRWQY